jgi:hypothetical protein
MLIIESLFRYPSREVKDSILTCYGGAQAPAQQNDFGAGFAAPIYDREALQQQGDDDEDEEDANDG